MIEAAVLGVDDDDVLDALEPRPSAPGGCAAPPVAASPRRRDDQQARGAVAEGPRTHVPAPRAAPEIVRQASFAGRDDQPERHHGAHGACALVPRDEVDPIALACPARPIRSSRDRRSRCSRARTRRRCASHHLPSSWPRSSRRLPWTSSRARRQRDLGDDAAHDLALQRPLRDVARQPAGVLDDEPHAPMVVAQRVGFGGDELHLRRRQRLPQQPLREARELALEQRRRRVAERVKAVPAADLDAAELRVVERLATECGRRRRACRRSTGRA